jgi:hypothetical protein
MSQQSFIDALLARGLSGSGFGETGPIGTMDGLKHADDKSGSTRRAAIWVDAEPVRASASPSAWQALLRK